MSDRTGVPKTCPLIDDVIAVLEWIANMPDDGLEIILNSDQIDDTIDIMEKIRRHNGDLREIAIHANDLEDELEEYKNKCNDLEWEVFNLKEKIREKNNE